MCADANLNKDIVKQFEANKTVRWPCRQGDIVLWYSFGKTLETVAGNPSPKIKDIWKYKTDASVLITSRCDDLPEWFSLHPLETSGRSARWMRGELNKGYQPMDEPLDGPNIWRVKEGGYLVRLGTAKPSSAEEERIVEVLELRENVLVIGTIGSSKLQDVYSVSSDMLDEKELQLCARVTDILSQRGLPRTMSLGGWTLP